MRTRNLVSLLFLLGLSGCDDDDDGDGGTTAFATGVAFKGPVTDATVTVIALRATGALGPVLGSGTTGAGGEFEVSDADSSSPARRARDEASGHEELSIQITPRILHSLGL